MSNNPKNLFKMNAYLNQIINFFDNSMHPAAGKETVTKKKGRTSNLAFSLQASPDCLNMRSTVRKQDNVRRNPAP